MNVAYLENNKPVAAYIDFDGMIETIVELMTDEREGFGENDFEKEIICNEYNDDFIQEIAFEMAAGFNRDMKKYLHLDNHKISGNFNNVEYDYSRENPGEKLSEMIYRLDSMEDSPRADKDRQWLTAWFWETFGTFGIKYNFGEQIADFIYSVHQDDEKYCC